MDDPEDFESRGLVLVHPGDSREACQDMVERAGRLLRSLYDRRSHADYDIGPVPREVADQAIEDAETVAGIIGEWLEPRSS